MLSGSRGNSSVAGPALGLAHCLITSRRFLYFSASEQRMLMRCMSNNTGTNSALARELNVSLPTVKKMWLSIYDRVAAHIPEWMSENSRSPPVANEARKKGAACSPIFRTTLKNFVPYCAAPTAKRFPHLHPLR